MGAYITKDRNGKYNEIIVNDKYDDLINKEFVMVFPIIEGEDSNVLTFNSFTRFLKAKGIKY